MFFNISFVTHLPKAGHNMAETCSRHIMSIKQDTFLCNYTCWLVSLPYLTRGNGLFNTNIRIFIILLILLLMLLLVFAIRTLHWPEHNVARIRIFFRLDSSHIGWELRQTGGFENRIMILWLKKKSGELFVLFRINQNFGRSCVLDFLKSVLEWVVSEKDISCILIVRTSLKHVTVCSSSTVS
jgi:hypothetical protein